jgi:hypothetical protein
MPQKYTKRKRRNTLSTKNKQKKENKKIPLTGNGDVLCSPFTAGESKVKLGS